MIARLFGAILEVAAQLIRTLLGGFLRAPWTAAELATQPITVRRGSAEEVVDVRHAVLRAHRPRETAIFEGDVAPHTRHWVADRGGLVVGVVTVLRADMSDGDARWQLRGMAVLPEYRGSGLGAALLSATHVDVAAPMWCNARQAVVPFYTRQGWVPVGDPFDIPPIGPHQRMTWRP